MNDGIPDFPFDDHEIDATAPANPADELGALVRGERPSDLAEEVARRLAEAEGVPDALRILIVGGGRSERDRLIARLAGRCAACRPAPSARHARRALIEEQFDVVMVHPDRPDELELAHDLNETTTEVAIVLVAAGWTAAQRDEAIRVDGVRDVVDPDLTPAQMSDRLRQAVRATRRASSAPDKLHYDETLGAMHSMQDDAPTMPDPTEIDEWALEALDALDHAVMDWDGEQKAPEVSDELDEALRDTLDVESALRLTLEHVLDKIGPTNAAIFLPDSAGDYSLGAYVNYDRPKDSAEVMLDHLAGVVAPRFERAGGLELIDDDQELHDRLGPEAHWLHGSTLLAFALRANPSDSSEEPLGVVALFRDPALGFTSGEQASCDDVRRVFGRRLARIARVHNRAKAFDTDDIELDAQAFDPDDWSPESDEGEDWGMAA